MRGYLREHWRAVAAYFAFAAIFAATFALYELPLEAVAYPAGLCLLLGALLMVSGWMRERKHTYDMVFQELIHFHVEYTIFFYELVSSHL